MGYPLIFDSNANDFISQGNGVLSDAIKCLVTENLNGSFELEMQYPVDGLHAEYIMTNNLIVCQANLTSIRQAFRIYEVKQQINGIATIYARHISYDLTGYPIEPFTATSLSTALSGLMSSAGSFTPPFTVTADFTSNTDFAVTEPSSIRSWFGGREGSIIDVYGGEWEYDNFNCYLRSRRGEDNGVRVQYGKNITKYIKDVKDNVYSHVCAFWTDNEKTQTVISDYVSTGISEVTRVKFIDTSTDYEEAPTKATLDALAAAKVSDYTAPSLNVQVGIIPLNNIQDTIELGDTVHVYYQNDIFTTRCVTVVWNVLKDMYESVSVGTLTTSFSKSVSNSVAADGYVTKKEVNAMIQKSAAAVIVETGTENGWQYKKFSDGTFEAYSQVTLTAVAATTSLGSGWYRTTSYSFGARPSFDTSTQLNIAVNFFYNGGSYTGMAYQWGAATSTSIGTYVVIRVGSSSSITGRLCATIKGTWS